MDSLAHALCLLCAMTGSTPQPEYPEGTIDIWHTHELIGRNAHLLRLSTTDRILDTDAARDQRLSSHARGFADRTCHGRFDLAPAERAAWPEPRPLYARQYVFQCR